jgi:hypothetical protein
LAKVLKLSEDLQKKKKKIYTMQSTCLHSTLFLNFRFPHSLGAMFSSDHHKALDILEEGGMKTKDTMLLNQMVET